jgi:hypothetical protein
MRTKGFIAGQIQREIEVWWSQVSAPLAISGIVDRFSQANTKVFTEPLAESSRDCFEPAQRPVRDTQHFALFGPVWRKIDQASNTDASGQPARD